MTAPIARPMKFGVVVDDFAGLAGATDFIVSFVDGLLRAAGERQIVLILRTPTKLHSPRAILRRLRAGLRGPLKGQLRQHVVGAPAGWQGQLDRLRRAGMADLPVLTCKRSEGALVKLARRHEIDIVGPLTKPPWGALKMPWLGYLFDFQHRHLPQFFDEEAVRYRDQLFRRMLTQADAVVVNARDVKNDAERYFPGLTERLFALPFSAAPKAEWLTADVGAARRVHGVGTRYFLVANQFWVHKRHEVAIEAFARLAASHSDLELVLTGATDDIRTPTRLQDIRDFIARLGLSRRIHILGLIPKTEQIALLRGAVAVIQPTSCEGGPGGGSVFDAVALGVPSVVSDIPVNREIAEHVSAYFPLDDVGALTTAMEAMLAAPRLAPDPRVLQAAGAARRTAMGERIWAAAEAAVRHAAPGRRC